MKKFITILIGCSLALAAGAFAQQEEAQPTPKKKQHEKAQPSKEAQPPAKAQPGRPAGKPHAVKKTKEPTGATNNARAQAPAKEESASATPSANPRAMEHKKKGRTPSKAPATTNEQAGPATGKANAQAAAQPPANQPNQGAHKLTAQTKKPDIKAIKAQHANFHAEAKPQQVPAVPFNKSRQIKGSEHWQGANYAAFRSYHPQMRDQNWYRSHYSRIQLIGGGYYYWNGGYWYPAWGYNPSMSYYVYDGPIYVGSRAEPPDRVIADVQASLLDLGYYQGEVDGLLGPLTRQALTGYQADHGLYTTAAIDEPTLASLGMD